jgi:hypothetical protein
VASDVLPAFSVNPRSNPLAQGLIWICARDPWIDRALAVARDGYGVVKADGKPALAGFQNARKISDLLQHASVLGVPPSALVQHDA